MTAVGILDVIRTKRDGAELTDEQIRWFIGRYTEGAVADEQAAALLMAIVWRGMSRRELATWTAAMVDSGVRMDPLLGGAPHGRQALHRWGGRQDLARVVPAGAACGAAVPQLSGRGLGHTGGTLDKMESIAGWSPHVDTGRYLAMLDDPGAVICAAGAELAPADARLYALRDVTATVESTPLIAGSIMSKKIAEGTGALVLDVKFGSGAFMVDIERARELAGTMVALGDAAGVRTAALLTDMDTPLGHTAGNALEVAEALDVLAGGGPPDVVELTVALAEVVVRARRHRRGPPPAVGLRRRDGHLAPDGRRSGRRSRRAAAESTPRRDRACRGRRGAHPLGRPAHRRSRSEPRRRQDTQGGPGLRRCRDRMAGTAR
ncbi:MAG: thymidine phosphorylase [Microthrixaceae bacterium]|nr:thymidine phosphorylase [Microthrixaceae bacterium]